MINSNYKSKLNPLKSEDQLKELNDRLRKREEQLDRRELNIEHKEKKITQLRSLLTKEVKQSNFMDQIKKELSSFKSNDKAYYYEYKSNNPLKTYYLLSDIHVKNDDDYYVIKSIFSLIKKSILKHNEKEITIAFTGDEIEGLLHVSSLHQNEGSIWAVRKFVEWTYEYLNDLSKICKINIIFVNQSNHGQTRALNTERSKLPKEDVGFIIEWALRMQSVGNKNIHWLKNEYEDNKGIVIVGDSMFIHGHQQWAKTKESIEAYINTLNIKIRRVFIGHWHQYKIISTSFGIIHYLPALKSHHSDYESDAGYKIDPSFIRYVIDNECEYSGKIRLPQSDRRINR